MSYLANPTSKTEYGVVEVGNFINVIDGIISLEQDVSPNANVTFLNANVSNLLTANTANIETLVASNANVEGTLVANVLTANTGNITVLSANTFTTANANVTGTLVANIGNITTLNAGNANVSGNLIGNNGSFSGNLTANGALVVTSVTPTASTGISISNLVPNGYAASFTVENTGVTYLNAGSGISLSGNTGNITISSFGADLINVTGVTANYTATITDEYIGVFSANAVTISLPAGFDGRVYTIKDEYGQGSGKITIQSTVGEQVDGKPNYVIGVPYQSVSVVSRASKWWII